MNIQERIYNLSKGIESLSKEEHGLFFDTVQRLGLLNDVKEAAVALYLDFKRRPVGEYNTNQKNLNVFLIASVSLAAKALGDLRTDQEFEHGMFVRRDRLIDAEERILKTFQLESSIVSFPEFALHLTRRQIQSMADRFAERELISSEEKDDLVKVSLDYLERALENGLGPQMSYRGRAAGVMLKAVRDLRLPIPRIDIARAAGFDKRTMAINAAIISSLLDNTAERDNSEKVA